MLIFFFNLATDTCQFYHKINCTVSTAITFLVLVLLNKT